MGWAQEYIKQLQSGETVEFRPRGHSMIGKVNNKDLVVVEPIKKDTVINKGDIVLCKVNGKEYLHLVKKISSQGQYQIGNNKGGINGWVTQSSIFGIMVKNKGK